MNCKPGDLAYIVAPFHRPARGRVVTVVEPAGILHEVDGVVYWNSSGGPSWVVTCPSGVPLENGLAPTRLAIQDNCLRPIAGPNGEGSSTPFDAMTEATA